MCFAWQAMLHCVQRYCSQNEAQRAVPAECAVAMTDTITLRTVDKFPEPAFTELVDRLLHDPDRRAIG